MLLQPLLEDWKLQPKLATSALKNLRVKPTIVLKILRAMQDARILCIPHCNVAIASCGKHSQWALALDVLQNMNMLEVVPNVVSYTSIIGACHTAASWTLALHILQQVMGSVLTPDAMLLSAVLTACARCVRWEAAVAILSEMPHFQVDPGVVAYNIVLNSLGKGGDWRKALELYASMPSRGVLANAVSSNTVITALARRSQWQLIVDTLACMPALHVAPDTDTFAYSLQAMAQAWRWEDAISLLVGMLMQDLKIDAAHVSIAMTACGSSAKWESALLLLSDSKCRSCADVGHYTTAIAACGCTEWETSLSLFAELRAQQLADVIAYSAALGACEASWQQALCLVADLGLSRLTGTLLTHTPAVSACGKAEQWQHALALLEELRDETIESDVALYTSVAAACTDGGQWHKALQLFAEMQRERLSIDGPALNAAFAACDKGEDWCTTLWLLHLWRNQHKGAPADSSVRMPCTVAVSVCGRAKQWRHALELLWNMSEAAVADTAAFNAAIRAVGRVQWRYALELFAALHLSDVPVDDVSYSAAMSACLEASQWMTSVALMEECRGRSLAGVSVYNAAISAWTESAAWQMALSLMVQLHDHRIQRNLITQSSVIHACGCGLTWQTSLQVLEATRACDLQPNHVAFGAIAYSSYRSRTWSLAVSVLASMCRVDLRPSLASFDYALLATSESGEEGQAMQLLVESDQLRSSQSFLWALATLRVSDPDVIHAACAEALAVEAMELEANTLSMIWWSMGMLGARTRNQSFEELMLEKTVVQLPSLSWPEMSIIFAAASMASAVGFLDAVQEDVVARVRTVRGAALNHFSFTGDGMELLGIIFSCRSAGCLRARSYLAFQKMLRSVGQLLDTRQHISDPGTWNIWNETRIRSGFPGCEEPRVVGNFADRAVFYKPEGWEVYGQHVELQLSTFVLGVLGHRPIFQDPDHNHGFLHRLDVPSSGLILVAKTYEAFYDLQVQLHAGELGRNYTVLCHGWLPRSISEIEASTWCEEDRPTLCGGRGKPASTKVLQSNFRQSNLSSNSVYLHHDLIGALSKLVLYIQTGRKHQIRSHMAHIGHPTVRDRVYAGAATFNFDTLLCARNWLHRHRLRFLNAEGSESEVFCDLPRDLKTSLDQTTVIKGMGEA